MRFVQVDRGWITLRNTGPYNALVRLSFEVYEPDTVPAWGQLSRLIGKGSAKISAPWLVRIGSHRAYDRGDRNFELRENNCSCSRFVTRTAEIEYR